MAKQPKVNPHFERTRDWFGRRADESYTFYDESRRTVHWERDQSSLIANLLRGKKLHHLSSAARLLYTIFSFMGVPKGTRHVPGLARKTSQVQVPVQLLKDEENEGDFSLAARRADSFLGLSIENGALAGLQSKHEYQKSIDASLSKDGKFNLEGYLFALLNRERVSKLLSEKRPGYMKFVQKYKDEQFDEQFEPLSPAAPAHLRLLDLTTRLIRFPKYVDEDELIEFEQPLIEMGRAIKRYGNEIPLEQFRCINLAKALAKIIVDFVPPVDEENPFEGTDFGKIDFEDTQETPEDYNQHVKGTGQVDVPNGQELHDDHQNSPLDNWNDDQDDPEAGSGSDPTSTDPTMGNGDAEAEQGSGSHADSSAPSDADHDDAAGAGAGGSDRNNQGQVDEDDDSDHENSEGAAGSDSLGAEADSDADPADAESGADRGAGDSRPDPDSETDSAAAGDVDEDGDEDPYDFGDNEEADADDRRQAGQRAQKSLEDSDDDSDETPTGPSPQQQRRQELTDRAQQLSQDLFDDVDDDSDEEALTEALSNFEYSEAAKSESSTDLLNHADFDQIGSSDNKAVYTSWIQAPADPQTYQRVKSRLNLVQAGVLRKLFLSKHRDQQFSLKGMKSGRLDVSKLAEAVQGVPTVYERLGTVTSNKLCVGVLIDESGSMSGGLDYQQRVLDVVRFGPKEADEIYRDSNKVGRARQAAIFLNECFGAVPDVKLFIYGHSADQGTQGRGTDGSCEMYVYREPGNRCSPTALGSVRARGNNRDGKAILLTALRMRRHTQEPGVIVVLSDGQPAGGNYYGQAAVDDTRQKVAEVERMGFTVIQVAIDAAVESEQMFTHFVKMTDIRTLPQDLVKFMSRQMSRMIHNTYKL